MKAFTLKIDGMSCMHCVKAVTTALEKAPGVTVGDVRIGSASGEFDPDRTSADGLARVVGVAGYSATVEEPGA